MVRKILIFISIFLFTISFFQINFQTKSQIFLKNAPLVIEQLQKEIKELELVIAKENSISTNLQRENQDDFVAVSEVKYIKILAPGVAISK